MSLEAVTELWDFSDGPLRVEKGNSTPKPKILLLLLLYCYTSGMFASRQIQERLTQDEILRYLALNRRPEWNELRRFRRRWRETIQRGLTLLLNKVWQHRFAARRCQTEDLDQTVLICRGTSTSVTLPQFIIHEARDRIIRAAQFDSMELDL